ncbi:MAG: hypothetical protein M1483_00280 [Actinobacteria bacterium]|nr:hypothetical protein [Actinomycetota bacterium]MCL6104074.1 hypothetical protein [Actinomycetota bacterium]
MNTTSTNPVTPPSLEIVFNAVDKELEGLTNHVESLDTKAGVILGFAGVVAGLAVSHGQLTVHYGLAIKIGLIIDVLAGILAMLTFLPRKWPVLQARNLRNKYLMSPAEETQLILLDSMVSRVNEISWLVVKKGWLIKFALASLAVAIALIAISSV